jgi:hypothetical protein
MDFERTNFSLSPSRNAGHEFGRFYISNDLSCLPRFLRAAGLFPVLRVEAERRYLKKLRR